MSEENLGDPDPEALDDVIDAEDLIEAEYAPAPDEFDALENDTTSACVSANARYAKHGVLDVSPVLDQQDVDEALWHGVEFLLRGLRSEPSKDRVEGLLLLIDRVQEEKEPPELQKRLEEVEKALGAVQAERSPPSTRSIRRRVREARDGRPLDAAG